MFAHYNDYNSTFDVHNQGETEIEQRIFEVIARCEQEKLNMRKEQEHNMEKHMNETNQILCEIEEKYSKKIEATSALICGLEDRVQQLMADADSSTRQRYDLEKQRAELESRVERLQADFQDIQAKHAVLEKENKNLTGDHEQEVRALKNKHEASVEFFKQELNLHSVRAPNNMSELEQHLSKLKQALDTADLDRQKSLREVEENKHKDIAHLKQLHSSKVRSLQTIHENLQDESKRKILKLEETIKEKDNNMARMQKQHEEHNQQAEKDIEEFKQQVHANSTKMHMDMKQQMDKASQDLNHSKQLREKQAKELQKQVETEKQTHQQKLREVSQKYEEKKKALDIEMQKEIKQLKMNKKQKLAALKNSYHNDRTDVEQMAKTRQDSDARTIVDLEHTVSKLRDEILQANQIRKQQLVELSVLKEEEKQKTQKEHEEQMTTLKSQYEEKLKSSIPVSVPQTLESMISILQDQVSSLKHHNTVLVQLLQLNKDLSPYLPTLSSSATLSNVHDFELSVHAANITKVTALHTTKPLESTKSPVHGTNGKTSTKHISSDDCAWNATDNYVYELTVMRKMRKQ